MYLLAVFVGLLFVSAKFHRLRVERQRAQGKVVEQQRHSDAGYTIGASTMRAIAYFFTSSLATTLDLESHCALIALRKCKIEFLCVQPKNGSIKRKAVAKFTSCW